MILESIQAGRPAERPRPAVEIAESEAPEPGRSWRSAIFKDALAGRVHLGRLNLEGDEQANRDGHGGPERAVLVYCAEHYAAWERELGRRFPAGGFGENLTVGGGMDETQACIGDVYRTGEAVIQLAEVRGPCYKLAYRLEQPDIIERVLETGRSGIYARVLQEGTVATGDPVELLERPHPDWPAVTAYRAYLAARKDPATAERLLAVEALSSNWRNRLNSMQSAR